MKTFFTDQTLKYDGSQLRSLYSFLDHNLQGDSIVSWVGPCDIPEDKIVDGQDLKEGSSIYSEMMLHFIIEIFDAKLLQMVLLQRLFCEIIKDEVYKLSQGQIHLVRLGDDLYFKDLKSEFLANPVKNQDLKFNISIATVSPVSGLIHFGINESSKNTPVKTFSLDLIEQIVGKEINVSDFAHQLMSRLAREWTESRAATQKVKWVK